MIATETCRQCHTCRDGVKVGSCFRSLFVRHIGIN